MTSPTEISRCRIGGGDNLLTVLDLGQQALTGVFPKNVEDKITEGPLELVWSPESGLLQLKHSYEPDEMYGDNYGYRSGLNQSMVEHLTRKVLFLERFAQPQQGDIIVDIGSNDCTTLKAYSTPGLKKIGIDPTGTKFASYYPENVKLVPEFFSEESYRSRFSGPAKIVTSIAMFYDLEDPIQFAKNIEAILADDGIWHFEQSYLPSMLLTNSYDTVCHEHLEYYSLQSVEKILSAAGLKVVDVIMNDVNGGSFAVTAAKTGNKNLVTNEPVIQWLRKRELDIGLHTSKPYLEFKERVFRHRDDLVQLIRSLVADGKTVLGYGASTKGNVTLQFCGLTTADIQAIAEVNKDKFGCFTPGSHIPIISEKEARAMNPDYFLVLPWHFKNGILKREQEYLANGGKFIFPFPEIAVV